MLDLNNILHTLGVDHLDLDVVAPVDQQRLGALLAEYVRHASSTTMPPAGPHAAPELTNEELTPGTGMLPRVGADDPNQQPSS